MSEAAKEAAAGEQCQPWAASPPISAGRALAVVVAAAHDHGSGDARPCSLEVGNGVLRSDGGHQDGGEEDRLRNGTHGLLISRGPADCRAVLLARESPA